MLDWHTTSSNLNQKFTGKDLCLRLVSLSKVLWRPIREYDLLLYKFEAFTELDPDLSV